MNSCILVLSASRFPTWRSMSSFLCSCSREGFIKFWSRDLFTRLSSLLKSTTTGLDRRFSRSTGSGRTGALIIWFLSEKLPLDSRSSEFDLKTESLSLEDLPKTKCLRTSGNSKKRRVKWWSEFEWTNAACFLDEKRTTALFIWLEDSCKSTTLQRPLV